MGDCAVSERESTAVLMKNSIKCKQEIYTSKICLANRLLLLWNATAELNLDF